MSEGWINTNIKKAVDGDVLKRVMGNDYKSILIRTSREGVVSGKWL